MAGELQTSDPFFMVSSYKFRCSSSPEKSTPLKDATFPAANYYFYCDMMLEIAIFLK